AWSEYIKGSDVFLTMDQHKYGYFAGEIAGKWAKAKFPNQADAKVMFVYIHAVKALAERGQGLIDGFKAYCPGATIVAEQDGNTPEEGLRAAETTLITHPDLNVVVACNDAVALGAYEALAAAGKKAGDVGIVGLDATPEALKRIRDNTMMIGTVDIGTYDQGKLFLRYSKETSEAGLIAEGADPRPGDVDFIGVSKENIANYF
ncbi:MAG: sugar ABC transporter substrate-binding protein, partial [Spirochaetaceae bacterium]|nr:sugar ABC transporter substrate-binding protein [Spirochaetaceae bacterium]